jgi:GNAT superfamily N-acetyltransferase
MNYVIVPFEKRHLYSVVSIHLKAFPNFFLSFLGAGFLREFYAAFLKEPTGLAFVAQEEKVGGNVLGVIVGTEQPAGFFKRLLIKKWWAFFFASMNALKKGPRISFRLFRALFYRGDIPPGISAALLSSIAVIPEAQGLGVGRLLIDRWLYEARQRGVPACYLTTDAECNDAVNKFYVRGGWKIDSIVLTPEGRKMNRYIYSFVDINE